MHQNLHISRLRTLITVVDLGGFRRAAEALHITQPAVSQHIRHLGALIRGPVFTSTGSSLRLSRAGEELVGYARRLVALNDEAVARFVTPRGRLQVAVGVSEQLADALPEFLENLSRRAPHIRVDVHTALTDNLSGRLTDGRLDLALLLNASRQGAGYETHELGRLSLAWFGRPPYGRGEPVPLALFTEPCDMRGHVMDSLSATATPWRIGYEGSEFIGLRAAVRAGLGFACLITNGDALWGLERSSHAALPDPPPPVPVALGVRAGIDPRVTASVRDALLESLHGYPFTGGRLPEAPPPGGPLTTAGT